MSFAFVFSLLMEVTGALRKLWDRTLGEIWWRKYADFWHRLSINRTLHAAGSGVVRRRRGIRRVVRLAGNFPGLWQRTIEQTPGGSCQWGGTLFVCDGPADHYVILNSISHPEGSKYLPKLDLPGPDRVWGLHMEPEEYVRKLRYDDPAEHTRTSRFYTNCESLIAAGGVYRPSPPYVHFLTGKSWDFLMSTPAPAKPVELGIIMSGLSDLPGHKARLAFLEALDQSGIPYALWGRGERLRRFRGYRGFALSKWNVHSVCKYSVVIENSVAPWYWTEKLADSLLGFSLPLYHGCPQSGAFFPPESHIALDINAPDTIDRIREVLREDPYEARLPALIEARRRILQEHNLYAFLDRELAALTPEP